MLVEEREFRLVPNGGARVRETTTWNGVYDLDHRLRYSETTRDDLLTSFKSYIGSDFLAEDSDSLSMQISDIEDPQIPVSLILDFATAKRGTTTRVDAAVAFPVGSLFNDLPSFLLQMSEGAHDEEDDSTADDAGAEKTSEF